MLIPTEKKESYSDPFPDWVEAKFIAKLSEAKDNWAVALIIECFPLVDWTKLEAVNYSLGDTIVDFVHNYAESLHDSLHEGVVTRGDKEYNVYSLTSLIEKGLGVTEYLPK